MEDLMLMAPRARTPRAVVDLNVGIFPGSPYGGAMFNPSFNPVNNPVNNPVFNNNPDLRGALSPYINAGNWSSPNLHQMGGSMSSLGPYGGYGMPSPYVYGGYGGYLTPYAYGSMSPYMGPWLYEDPYDLEEALNLGYISAPQYNQFILMMDGRHRKRGLFRYLRGRRDPYMMRFSRGPGIGFGGHGRRGILADMDIIPGGGLFWR